MTYPVVEINIDGSSVIRMLRRLEDALGDGPMSYWLQRDAAVILRDRAMKRFVGEGDSASGFWAQLAPKTVQLRGSAHPINHVTGELENYIVNADGDVKVSGTTTVLQYPDGYGAGGELLQKVNVAQKGNPRNQTPARPVLAVNSEDMELLLVSFAYNLSARLAGVGI